MHAVSRARPAFEFGLNICAFLFLPILVLASRGAAPLVATAGVCALGIVAPRGTVAWSRVRGLALLLGAIVVWGLASALWAIDPGRSGLIALRLAAMFVAGLALIAAAEEIAAPGWLMACLAAGFAVALALTVTQVVTKGALTASLNDRAFFAPVLNQAEDGFGLLLLPFCAALILQRRRLAAAAVAVMTVAVICVLVGETARAAFLVGVLAAALLYVCRSGVTRAAAVGSVVLILAAPLIFPPLARIAAVESTATQYFKNSLWHRLEIWSFVGARIVEKPLLGWGLDASRAIPGGNQPVPGGYPGQVFLPLHPHNAPLQLWLELGVPGALLFTLFVALVWLALGAARWPRLYAAASGGSLVMALIVGLGSYGIWQEWWICTEFLTLFLILVMARLAAQPIPEIRSGSIS